MSVVASYTREQWEALGGWRGVDVSVDGVTLLFREEDSSEDDVLPVCIRIDPATNKPWPEDRGLVLPDVPFRYYRREGRQWVLEAEGADQAPHERIRVRRPYPTNSILTVFYGFGGSHLAEESKPQVFEPTAEPLTKEALLQLGFEIIHMNPDYNGGYFKLIKDLPTPAATSVSVTFGCYYCLREQLPYIVWIGIGGFMESTAALVHIKTIGQLDNLWLALTGAALSAPKEAHEAQ